MMPDLGPYAGTVLGAYAVTLVLLAALVLVSWRRSVGVRRTLARLETEMKGRSGG